MTNETDDWRLYLTEREDAALSKGWLGNDAMKRRIASEIAESGGGDVGYILARLQTLTSVETKEAIGVAAVLAVMPQVERYHAARAEREEPPEPTDYARDRAGRRRPLRSRTA